MHAGPDVNGSFSDTPWNGARVTVVLPLYRPGPGLAEALTRLAATVSTSDEVLVVDDGTPPPGNVRLARLVREHLPGVSLHVLPTNGGVAAARNHAVRFATGRYVWFVDWDDSWDRSILDVLITHAEAVSASVVTCRADVVDADGRLVRRIGPAYDLHLRGQETGQALLDGRLEGHLWNKLFRRDRLPANLFPLVPTLSDLLGTAPVLAAADRVEHVGRVLYVHRVRPGSLTATADRDLSMLLTAGREVPDAVAPFLDTGLDTAWRSTLFRHRSAYLTAVTALRLAGDSDQQDQWVQRSLELVTLGEAVSLLRRSPTTATRSLALLGFGPAFAPLYRQLASLRARLRRRVPDQRGDGGGRG